jgi:sigma-54 specific flagellar transcriptional regulator A
MRSATAIELADTQAPMTDPATVLLGDSLTTRQLRGVIARVARADVTVLITGETGTGKELVARCLHLGSPRHQGPFVAVNCAAIPAALLEAEFFGYERGAFTGAASAKSGRLESARGGTLFLDEIGDMPLELQAKLLRVLQERTFERVGGTRSVPVECRIVAATHADLPAAIAQGRFREDLYYRLNVLPLYVPPLRDRPDDVMAIAHHAIQRVYSVHGTRLQLADDAISALREHDWPGNVRELTNLIERLAILSGDQVVSASDLRLHLSDRQSRDAGRIDQSRGPLGARPGPAASTGSRVDLRTAVADFEAGLIEDALEACGGVITRAAIRLGVPRSTLMEKIQRLRQPREMRAKRENPVRPSETTAIESRSVGLHNAAVQPPYKENQNELEPEEVLYVRGGRRSFHGVRRHHSRVGPQGLAAVGVHRWRPSAIPAR